MAEIPTLLNRIFGNDIRDEIDERDRLSGLYEDLPPDEQDRAFFAPASLWSGLPVPDREWLVSDLIPHKNVTLLGGDGGTGKSLLALQVGVAVATNRKWIGYDIARPGTVMFLSAEDDHDELHRRVVDIAKHEGVGLADLGGLQIHSTVGQETLLATFNRKTNQMAKTTLFNRLAEHMACKPALLVLDTLANLHSGEEVSRTVAQQFVNAMRALALEHECAVLLLMHPSLSGMSTGSGTSGSTGWNNAVRSRLYLTREKDGGKEADPDKRILRTMKANYAAADGETALWWCKGVFVREVKHEPGRESPADRARRVFMKLLDTFTKNERWVSPNPSKTYAPSLFAAHPDAENCTKVGLTRAMEELFNAGMISTDTHGRGNSVRQHIVRVK